MNQYFSPLMEVGKVNIVCTRGFKNEYETGDVWHNLTERQCEFGPWTDPSHLCQLLCPCRWNQEPLETHTEICKSITQHKKRIIIPNEWVYAHRISSYQMNEYICIDLNIIYIAVRGSSSKNIASKWNSKEQCTRNMGNLFKKTMKVSNINLR